MNLLDIPLKAIESFEKSTSLPVCYHILDSGLWTYLPSTRSLHFAPSCAFVKDHWLARCVDLEQHQVRSLLADQPHGFMKVCHAGLLEWVCPVFHESTMRLILFAGPRTPTPQVHALSPFTQHPQTAQAKALLKKSPPPSSPDPQITLELLSQLAARLEQWLRQMDLAPPSASPGLDRRRWIIHFLHQRHTGPVTIDDLAKAMSLSPSRAAHIVKETSGQSFGALLTQVRVRTAANLLAHTNLSILHVALQSGFGDVSNFHRRFRARLKMTPLQYRKRAEATRATVQLTLDSR